MEMPAIVEKPLQAIVGLSQAPIQLPRRPASAGASYAGSPWRNPGRLRLRDVDLIRTAPRRSRSSRPASAPSCMSTAAAARMQAPPIKSELAAEASSKRELLVAAYSDRVEGGQLQHQKLACKASNQDDDDEMSAQKIEQCPIPGHMATLRDDVYIAKCDELRVKANSGVLAWISGDDRCMCQRHGGNLRNMLLGNRGVLAVLPLLDCMKSLRSLSLVGNGLRGAGVKAVINAMSTEELLPLLCTFDLSHNPLSSPSSDDLEPLLHSRTDLLLLGLAGTSLGSAPRQRLMRKAMTNFNNAPADKALEAWQLAASTGFADVELKASYAASAEVLQTMQQPRPLSQQPQPPPGPKPAVRRKAPMVLPTKVAYPAHTSTHRGSCECKACKFGASAEHGGVAALA